MTPLNFILAIAVGFLLFRLAEQEIDRRAEALQVAEAKHTQSTPTPTQKRTEPMSALLKKLIEESGDDEITRAAYAKWMKTAPQFEIHGTVRRHLPDGHVFVTCFVSSNGSGHSTSLVLWGLPSAPDMADGDIFDCYALAAEPMKMPDGSMVREYVYADPAGRHISSFERSIYP